MSEEKTDNKIKQFGFFSKLKKIKHLDIILTVLFIAIILLIYFSTFSTSDNGNDIHKNKTSNDYTVTQLQSSDELIIYASTIELKLKNIISQIKDAGTVSVVVGFNGKIEKEFAYSIKTEEDAKGIKTEIKTPVLVTENGKTNPLILKTIMPEVDKIIVVASGAKNTNVKLEILRAVQAIYSISNIQIFAGN